MGQAAAPATLRVHLVAQEFIPRVLGRLLHMVRQAVHVLGSGHLVIHLDLDHDLHRLTSPTLVGPMALAPENSGMDIGRSNRKNDWFMPTVNSMYTLVVASKP